MPTPFDDLMPGADDQPSPQSGGGLFDDLVPKSARGAARESPSGLFDDLVPQRREPSPAMQRLLARQKAEETDPSKLWERFANRFSVRTGNLAANLADVLGFDEKAAQMRQIGRAHV